VNDFRRRRSIAFVNFDMPINVPVVSRADANLKRLLGEPKTRSRS
jgi:hypothetical protein